MKKTLNYLLVSILTMAAFSSCTKDGATGPQGPKGAQGNADVQSMTVTVQAADWIDNNSPIVIANIADSEITADIMANGAVLVYAFDYGSYFVQLPYTYGVYQTTCYTSVGTVQIQVVTANGSNQSEGATEFRIVAIAGSARKELNDAGINLKDYTAVKTFLKLKDY